MKKKKKQALFKVRKKNISKKVNEQVKEKDEEERR